MLIIFRLSHAQTYILIGILVNIFKLKAYIAHLHNNISAAASRHRRSIFFIIELIIDGQRLNKADSLLQFIQLIFYNFELITFQRTVIFLKYFLRNQPLRPHKKRWMNNQVAALSME